MSRALKSAPVKRVVYLMKDMLCRWLGHTKPNIHFPRDYEGGVMIYVCPRCKCWTRLGEKGGAR